MSSHLASELLTEIVSNLSANDIKAFSTVCWRFWWLVAPIQYGRVILTPFRPTALRRKDLVRALTRARLHIGHIVIINLPLSGSLVTDVLSLAVNLVCMELMHCREPTSFPPIAFPRLETLSVSSVAEPNVEVLQKCLTAFPSVTTWSLGCPTWQTNGSVLLFERRGVTSEDVSLRLWGGQESDMLSLFMAYRPLVGIRAMEVATCANLQEFIDPHRLHLVKLRVLFHDVSRFSLQGFTALSDVYIALHNCEDSISILCGAVRDWKNEGKLHLCVKFSSDTFGGEIRERAVEGYSFWRRLEEVYQDNRLSFNVIIETFKRERHLVRGYDNVHGPLILAELPKLDGSGRLTVLPVKYSSIYRSVGLYDF
ncbi:hypothetical protein C8J56DRAFT_1041977 [Mycena floridula]|nr:hypothetical protein C8J56DRAFT_1041977 [Mycena floridula]